MNFTSSELNSLYKLVRLEANRICQEHNWQTTFEQGSWAQQVMDLDRKLSADYHARVR